MHYLLILFFLPTLVFSANPFLKNEADSFSHEQASHTFLFWVNGDSERYRPAEGIGSETIQIDALDVQRIKGFAKDCDCNVVIFHDQRLSDKWYTSKNKFGTFITAFSKGKQVKFKYERKRITRKHKNLKYETKTIWKDDISFDEVHQDSLFLTHLIDFTKNTFPNTKYHLIYRGHSFANSKYKEPAPFDFSNLGYEFHKEQLQEALEKSSVKFETITFAACSMSNISFALMLSKHAKYMISSQVNINETGKTGFSFNFLRNIHNNNTSTEISEIISENLLENFSKVNDPYLYIRETPITLIDLEKLKALKKEIINAIDAIPNILEKDEIQKSKVKVNVSNRYTQHRKNKGANDAEIKQIASFIEVASYAADYDFGNLLIQAGYSDLYKKLEQSITLKNSSKLSFKKGVSLDLTYR